MNTHDTNRADESRRPAGLFDPTDLPLRSDVAEPPVEGGAPATPETARVDRPQRRQIEWRPLLLEQMLPVDHRARTVWAFVMTLDLSPYYADIEVTDSKAGRSANVPLETITQDGMGVRASAGSSSFRRRPTLEQLQEEARKHVERLKKEAENEVVSSLPRSEQLQEHGKNLHAPQKGDMDEYAAFRARMAEPHYQKLYKIRPSVAEFPHADCRGRRPTARPGKTSAPRHARNPTRQ